MWDDVAALVPPLVMAVAFCALLFSLLRREMGGKRRHHDDGQNGHSGR